MKKTTSLLLATTAVLLMACGDNTPPEEIVKQRALARWAIREQGKVDGLYEFLSPAKRQTVTKADYEKRLDGGFKYFDVEVRKVTCEQDNSVCRVTLYVGFEIVGQYGKNTAGTVLEEKWIKEGKQWWFAR